MCELEESVLELYARCGVPVFVHRSLIQIDLSNGRLFAAGVSLALSELCQDCRYGGGRIPLSAILDLSTWSSLTSTIVRAAQQRPVRQHQRSFVPLGPQVEKDVPKRLIQLVRSLSLGPLIFSDRKAPNSNTYMYCLGKRERSFL